MKYLMLKHYRGAPAGVNDHPMDEWTQDEIDAHIAYMNDFAQKLTGTGEFVDGQALASSAAVALTLRAVAGLTTAQIDAAGCVDARPAR